MWYGEVFTNCKELRKHAELTIMFLTLHELYNENIVSTLLINHAVH